MKQKCWLLCSGTFDYTSQQLSALFHYFSCSNSSICINITHLVNDGIIGLKCDRNQGRQKLRWPKLVLNKYWSISLQHAILVPQCFQKMESDTTQVEMLHSHCPLGSQKKILLIILPSLTSLASLEAWTTIEISTCMFITSYSFFRLTSMLSVMNCWDH